jgi:cell division initiation protein
MNLTALEIKKKEFEQKMRGYDIDEVRRFLEQTASEFEQIIRDNISLEEELADTKKKLEHYLGLESTLEKTLLAAQQTALKMEEQAKKEAELILSEARLEKERSLKDIPLEIERARGEVTRLKAEYESTVARMKSLLEGFHSFINNISDAA